MLAVWPLATPLRAAPVDACTVDVPTRTIVARRINGRPPHLDGRLDEPAWQSMVAVSGFTQHRPRSGAPATERTEARVLYDDQALYIAMRMYTPDPRTIAGTVARRDYEGYSDWAQVMIDSYHDRRTAFAFAVNPAGVQRDVLMYDDGGGQDSGWNAVWESAASTDSLGWTAELQIPLSQLRFSTSRHADSASVWGIEFVRDIAHLNERDVWAPVPARGPGCVSWFGDLTGLVGLDPVHRLELLPYARASLTRAPGNLADPLFQPTDPGAKIGADLKYGLTSNLTLTGTVNPDFGQVEADPSVVNLTAYETFLPEQRPFFTEGVQIFRFNTRFPFSVPGSGFGSDQPFYSRRIGRAPQASVPDSARYQEVPDATTILGAAKLSGKTARGWSIGLLDAVTGPATARYIDPSGSALQVPVEPMTNYAVARGSKDFRTGLSAVGGFATATTRRIENPALGLLPTGAYTAGVDGRHRFGGGNYELSGSMLGSYLRGSPEAVAAIQRAPGHYFQRADARYLTLDTTRTRLGGYSANAQLGKIGGAWRWSAAALARSPGLDLNDLGFQRTADWLLGGVDVSYVEVRPGRVLRDWQLSTQAVSGWSFGGERRTTGIRAGGNVNFLNTWSASVNVGRQLPALSIDELRGGPAIVLPAYSLLSAGVQSDQRRRVVVQMNANAESESETGRRRLAVQPAVTARVGGRTELSLAPAATWTDDPRQYVTQTPALGATRYLFARIRQTTAALTARASYSFTPDLSLQFYGQPFISAGGYSEFKLVAQPRAPRFRDRFRPIPGRALAYDDSARRYRADIDGNGVPDLAFDTPDFNVQQFRSTSVLRWQFRPGSTLFVVWSQGRSLTTPLGTFDLRRDSATLFGGAATNVLLVKLTFWTDV